jgi:hypothetical protein
MKIDDFLLRLEAVSCNGSKATARCPAHEDRTPSLSIGVGDDGKILLKPKFIRKTGGCGA